MEGAILIGSIDAVAREATLFAAIWFLVGGLDDLAVDLVYLARRGRRWAWRGAGEAAGGVPDAPPGRIAVFVPAWHEANVIGGMLRTALARFDHPRLLPLRRHLSQRSGDDRGGGSGGGG